mmetsp:Transcript_7792/g.16737  ORF Transcript_7792/g.16737 Transcript_7792/m.16737 type:complete len:345 (-) Transcript_7792:646-1680(-)|eukprot:CAMPEP_0202911154 /NCGR_PEP_ID=MMETSP1392-20130828/54194_1 /ASSEMBLY_ACC=CAM_ASM_000868 /TAXON_ID=225041 /ORGANISM="Chlamydomonas chlamydogama, Strain SAG 11-48b" /LENGTH=344 /DNA_ID=CAMNT_0049601555 /DNA_START=205 /DNA_END=1239 /DNA_ORIENTATION=-
MEMEREEEQTSTSGSVGCGTATSASTDITTSSESAFISHKVSKLDTLAGIAVKYNVPIADIKRMNGLLSESAMYGRDTLLIPTKLLPVGEEVQMIFAQIATGIGRDPVLNYEANMHPASAAVARVARTLHIVDEDTYLPDYGYGDGVASWCQCGTCIEDDESMYQCRRRTGSSGDPGNVELTEYNAPGTSAGPTRMHDRVRRRRAAAADGQPDDYADYDDDGRLNSRRDAQGTSTQPWHTPLVQNSQNIVSSGAALLSSLGKALGDLPVVQKIKRAASQPALAGPGYSTFGDAADGVLSSLRNGLLPKGGLATGRSEPLSSVPLVPKSYNAMPTHKHKPGSKAD